MDTTVGIVLPVYRPDMEQLEAYLAAIRRTVGPDALLLEWDAPDPVNVQAVREQGVPVHTAEARRGKGAAITAGFDRLDTDVLLFADSDGSTPARSLQGLVQPITGGAAEVAAGSRRHPDTMEISHASILRRHLGDVFASLARRVINPPLHDYQCGAKAIHRQAWQRVRPWITTDGFAWDIELLGMAHAHGARIVEVPVEWEDRPQSTVAPARTAIKLLRTLNRVTYRQRMIASAGEGRAGGAYLTAEE